MERVIKDYMTELPHTIGVGVSVQKAVNTMREYHCHHLPVLDGGHLVGVISSNDLRILKSSSDQDKTRVSEIMTDEPYIVDPDAPIRKVIKEMLSLGVGSAIVRAKEGQKWGIFTMTDALKLLITLL